MRLRDLYPSSFAVGVIGMTLAAVLMLWGAFTYRSYTRTLETRSPHACPYSGESGGACPHATFDNAEMKKAHQGYGGCGWSK